MAVEVECQIKKVNLWLLLNVFRLCYDFLCSYEPWGWLSWLKQGANNAKVMGLIPGWAIHLSVRLKDPSGSLPTHTILCFCGGIFLFSWAFLHVVSYCHGIIEWLGFEKVLKILFQLLPWAESSTTKPKLLKAPSNLVFANCCFKDPHMKTKF